MSSQCAREASVSEKISFHRCSIETFEAVPAADQESVAKCNSSNSLILTVPLEGILFFWDSSCFNLQGLLELLRCDSWRKPCPAKLGPVVPLSETSGQRSHQGNAVGHLVLSSGSTHAKAPQQDLPLWANDGLSMSTKHTPGEAQKAGASPWPRPENITRAPRHREMWKRQACGTRCAHGYERKHTLQTRCVRCHGGTLPRVFKLRFLVPTRTRGDANDLLNWWAPWKEEIDPVSYGD